MFLHQTILTIPTATVALALFSVAHRAVLIALLIFAGIAGTAQAAADERALKLYFTHTGEKATIVFKRNGKFDPKGLARINRFLRDWRRNEPTRMDPKLLDLVWEVYQRSGAKEAIHVVSAYRSPATNNMLRNRSRNTGVAKKSQHMLGKAMDFYIPGVKLTTLRALAMQAEVGGVGYYPNSGSPFVHLDVGNVRAWPRMSRQELVRLFPDGRTIHVPADGRALPGYNLAMAEKKKRSARPIEVARDTGEDDEAGADAAPAKLPSTLATAMLPIPQSRAREALALTSRSKADDEAAAPPMPEVASLVIPLPITRPQVDDITVASIATAMPAMKPPVTLASLVVGKGHSGELLIASQQRAALSGLNGETSAPTPIASTMPVISAGVGGISTRSLVTWALSAPGSAVKMTAPRLHGADFDEDEDDEAFDLADDDFDADRFAVDG